MRARELRILVWRSLAVATARFAVRERHMKLSARTRLVDTNRIVGRVSLRVFCLAVAPVMGFLAGSIVAQGPSNESDALSSAVVGGGAPGALSFAAARLLGEPTASAAKWAVASVAATGVFWVLFVLVFFLSFNPV